MPSTTSEELFDLLADAVYAGKVFIDALLYWRVRPVRLDVQINGQEKSGMALQIPDDQTFTIHVAAFDKFGDPANETGTFTITASNPSLCNIQPDEAGHPGDSSWAIGTPLAGAGQFVINAIDTGGIKGSSDELDITPGAPAVLHIDINAS